MTSPLPTDEDAREYTPSTIEVLCRYQEWAGGSSSDEVRRAEFERWLAGFRLSVVSTPDPEALARRFHEAYERLAPEFGYKTREASAVPWEDVPDANKRLMIATCAAVSAPPTITDEWCVDCRHCRPHQGITNPPCGKTHDCPECASQRVAAAVSDSSSATPIPDEMVERAARAGFEHVRGLRPADHGPYRDWAGESEQYREYLRGIQRAALRAALGGEA